MKRIAIFSLLVYLLSSAALINGSAGVEPRPVKTGILADVSAVKPGASFEVGVLFDIEPRWHIYWKHPGDSGLPTSVEFALPRGFTVTDVKWPVPAGLSGAGNLRDYGYEDSLLLSARVNSPSDLKPGSIAKITARVSWVGCKDICIPGKAELELKLPVSESVESVNSDLFSEWQSRLPVNHSGGAPPFEIDLKTVSKSENEYSVVVLLSPKDAISGIGLYPVPGNSFIVDDIVVGTDEGSGKSALAFNVKVLPSRGPSQNELETLIVYTDKSGKRSGYEFPVTLFH